MTDLTHAQAPSFASFKAPVCLSARLIQVLFGLAIALGRTGTTPLPGGKPRTHASQQAGNCPKALKPIACVTCRFSDRAQIKPQQPCLFLHFPSCWICCKGRSI